MIDSPLFFTLIFPIVFVFVLVNLLIFFFQFSKLRNYLKEKHPDKFKELGGLNITYNVFNGTKRTVSNSNLMKILYGSEDFGDPKLAKLKRKIKIQGILSGVIGAIIIIFLLILIFS